MRKARSATGTPGHLDKKGREDVIARIRERLKGLETAVVLYRRDPAKYRESADEAPALRVEAAMAAIGDPDSEDLSAADSDHADALSVLVAEACVRTYGNTPWKELLGKDGVVQRLVDRIDDRAFPFGIIKLLREADQAEVVRLALQEAHATLSRCANKAAVVQRLRRMIRDVFTAVLRAQGNHAYEAAVLCTSNYRKDVNVGRVVLLQALRGSDVAVDLFLSGTPMTNTAAIYVANLINAEPPKRPDPRALCVTLPSGAEMCTHGEDAVVLFDTEGNVIGRTGVRTEKGDRDVEWKDLLKAGYAREAVPKGVQLEAQRGGRDLLLQRQQVGPGAEGSARERGGGAAGTAGLGEGDQCGPVRRPCAQRGAGALLARSAALGLWRDRRADGAGGVHTIVHRGGGSCREAERARE